MASRSIRRARRRRTLAELRKLAPRHPPAPEARIRSHLARFIGDFQDQIKSRVKAAHKAVGPALSDLPAQGQHQLRHSRFRSLIAAQAAHTAASTRFQVGRAIGKKPTADLTDRENQLTADVYDVAHRGIAESVERAEDIWGDWDGEDEAALHRELDDGLDGVLGSLLASAGLAFGYAFAGMNRDAQVDAGVSEYAWIAQKDSATRPEHRALDGEQAGWDDPLLSAEDSSSGEECYPGDDYNCRCVAAPVVPE